VRLSLDGCGLELWFKVWSLLVAEGCGLRVEG